MGTMQGFYVWRFRATRGLGCRGLGLRGLGVWGLDSLGLGNGSVQGCQLSV